MPLADRQTVENARLIALLDSQRLGRSVREPRFCWSADGKHLVYLADGQLRVTDAPDFTGRI